MENKYKIYKFLTTPNNEKLAERVETLLLVQEPATKLVLNNLKFNTVVTNKKLAVETFKENTDSLYLYYVVMLDDKIIGSFTHTYHKGFNQIYLQNSKIADDYAGKGIGSTVYRTILDDIKTKFEPDTICANATSLSGKKFLTKMGFLPNTCIKSADCNSILYCKNQNMTFMNLTEIPACRNINMAPNIGLYNSMLRDRKIKAPETIVSEKQFIRLQTMHNKMINGANYLKNKEDIFYPVNFSDIAEIDMFPHDYLLRDAKRQIQGQIDMLKNLKSDTKKEPK